MGLFYFLFNKGGKASQNDQLLELVNVSDDIMIPRALANHWEAIQKTGLPSISINAIAEDDLALEQSKFGHYPCIPEGFPYPTSADGSFLYPLAQINLGEFPDLEGFPASGYLQFYIATDDLYGVRFENLQDQSSFRVLYFEEEEVENKRVDFSFLDPVLQNEDMPVNTPHSLSFTAKMDYIGMCDFRRENNPHFNASSIGQLYPSLERGLRDILFEKFSCTGHKIGGYAYFTQNDPRSHNSVFQEYILLLQIDSDDEIMWGDMGVASFLIHPADLAKKDFSKVIYTWDCH